MNVRYGQAQASESKRRSDPDAMNVRYGRAQASESKRRSNPDACCVPVDNIIDICYVLSTKHNFSQTKSKIVRKNPAFRGTPPALGRSRSSTTIDFLMKINNLYISVCDKRVLILHSPVIILGINMKLDQPLKNQHLRLIKKLTHLA